MHERFTQEALMLVILSSGIPLAVSSLCSLFLAILQSVTQIQEQTLAYLIRFVSIVVVLYLCAGWFAGEFIFFLQRSLAAFEYLGQVK